tara:strand:- start:767 stop:1642 length:876 start_codon:yes stop_codon:yes gene_type:complete
MGGYTYVAPATVADALTILSEHKNNGTRAQVLAGGTDLLVQMRSGDNAGRAIVDIKNIKESNNLVFGETETFIGAAISSAVLNESEKLKELFPGLLEAADLIGSTQIQGRATIAGNLCNASPAGDTIPALIANSGVCIISGPSGERQMAVEEFVTGVGTNALSSEEFVLGLRLPNPALRTSDAYLRFIPRTEMDIAVAGAGVSLSLSEDGTCIAARVAIGAVAPTALLVEDAAEAIVGSKLDEGALSKASEACSGAASPISDKRGTAEYRRKVVGVLCKRAAVIARDRALS